MNITIRNEVEADYKLVEDITRKAFYNLYVPGCDEHYLVHIIRAHKDFIKELDFVIEVDGEIIGNIMYTKAKLVDEVGIEKEVLTFGPISILPEYQRQGYSQKLLDHSFEKAIAMGYDTIIIFGNPSNYVSRGFKSCKKYNICMEGDVFPTGMMCKELVEGRLDGRKWVYSGSEVMNVDQKQAKIFDDALEEMEKKVLPSQEEFYILSSSIIQ